MYVDELSTRQSSFLAATFVNKPLMKHTCFCACNKLASSECLHTVSVVVIVTTQNLSIYKYIPMIQQRNHRTC